MNRLLRRILLSLSLLFTLSVGGAGQNNIKEIKMKDTLNQYGIAGTQAPEFNIAVWIDSDGKERKPIKLADYEGKFKVIYCFQAWCPGCHSQGLPSLKKMVDALEDNDKVEFLAVQTVFEGAHANTLVRVKEIQKQYDLKIPFGHDVGDETTRNISNIMYNYRTGGTPWFILIDETGRVIFNDFHLNTEKAIEFLKKIK